MASPSPESSSSVAGEAARYALLRRLAPSIRHHLVVHLQPVGMLYELLDRRLNVPEPRLADVRETAEKMNRLAKAAMASSLDVITWLSPDESASTTLQATVQECIALVGSSLGFRGFVVRNEVEAGGGEVRQGAVRALVCASLVHLTDVHPPPASVELRSSWAEGAVELDVALVPTEGEPGFSTSPAYRPLSLDDVKAIAFAEAVGLEEREDGLRLRFPCVGVMPRG